MSRFAANPKWLIYLPPTMSPCETSQRAGPAGASGRGVRLLPQPRACRRSSARRSTWARGPSWSSARARGRRRGASARRAQASGVVLTRTGRRFFDDQAVEAGDARPGRRRDGSLGALGRAGRRLGRARRRADALERQGGGPPARPVRAGRGRRPGRPRCSSRRYRRASSRGASSWAGSAPTDPRAPAESSSAISQAYGRYCWPTAGLDGPASSPRSTCWPPGIRPSSTATTPGTWPPWPGWPRPTPT